MSEEIIKYDNLKWLWTNFDTEQEVNDVSNYLKENNTYIKKEALQNSSGMSIYTLEGFQFREFYDNKEILQHVRNYKKYLKISFCPEYKEYLELREKFEHVFKYINNR